MFGSIFLIREEALIFGLILILYNYFSTEIKRDRLITTVIMLFGWLAALFVTISYFNWADYSFDEFRSPLYLLSVNPSASIAAAIFGLVAIILTWRRRIKNLEYKGIRFFQQLSVFGLLLLPLAIQLKIEISNWDLGPGSFFSTAVPNILLKPYVNLFVIVSLLFLVLLWSGLSQKLQKTIIPGLLILTIFVVGYNMVSLKDQLNSYQRDTIKAEIVFEVREQSNYLSASIMSDYETYQVFYDYENLFVFNRLTSHLIEKRKDRYFPENTVLVEKLLVEEIEYVVVSQANRLDILELINQNEIEILDSIENNSYSIFRIR